MNLLIPVTAITLAITFFLSSKYISWRLPRVAIAFLAGFSALMVLYFLFAASRLNYRHTDPNWPRPAPYPDQFVQKVLSNWELTQEELFMRPRVLPKFPRREIGLIETYRVISGLGVLASIVTGFSWGLLFGIARTANDRSRVL